jgi:hypothetical protein
MEEYISADPCKYDHHNLFKCLQTLTLDFRLADPYCSLVRIIIISILNLFSKQEDGEE